MERCPHARATTQHTTDGRIRALCARCQHVWPPPSHRRRRYTLACIYRRAETGSFLHCANMGSSLWHRRGALSNAPHHSIQHMATYMRAVLTTRACLSRLPSAARFEVVTYRETFCLGVLLLRDINRTIHSTVRLALLARAHALHVGLATVEPHVLYQVGRGRREIWTGGSGNWNQPQATPTCGP